jgi:hypothetical protein
MTVAIERIETIPLRILFDHWAPPPLFGGKPRTTMDSRYYGKRHLNFLASEAIPAILSGCLARIWRYDYAGSVSGEMARYLWHWDWHDVEGKPNSPATLMRWNPRWLISAGLGTPHRIAGLARSQ